MVAPSVLFEDNHCLALSKPGGLLTQGLPVGLPTLWAWARDYLRATYNKTGNVYLGVPHRLDRPVSGVVLFAKSSKAAARLAEQFRHREVTKVYHALVSGAVEPAEGVWVDWLRKLQDLARAEIVTEAIQDARRAETAYRVLETAGDTTLLELLPHTGRMHQLRIQSASRGWPILGDATYGSHIPFGPPAELERDRVIALHAASLTFLHPIRYEPMTVTAPRPDYWPALG
ncbi:MAG: RluA family pseudouridine synthase [Gemmataceae bacterium]